MKPSSSKFAIIDSLDFSKNELAKPEKLIKWLESHHKELIEAGKNNDKENFEKIFSNFLGQLSSLHESISSAAKKLKLSKWRADFELLRETDSLLFYFWKLRNFEVHDAIDWKMNTHSMSVRIIDIGRMLKIGKEYYIERSDFDIQQRVYRYVWGATTDQDLARMQISGVKPDLNRCIDAGIEISEIYTSFGLFNIENRRDGKKSFVAAPTFHLGHPIAPIAVSCALAVLNFYSGKVVELQEYCEYGDWPLDSSEDIPAKLEPLGGN